MKRREQSTPPQAATTQPIGLVDLFALRWLAARRGRLVGRLLIDCLSFIDFIIDFINHSINFISPIINCATCFSFFKETKEGLLFLSLFALLGGAMGPGPAHNPPKEQKDKSSLHSPNQLFSLFINLISIKCWRPPLPHLMDELN